MYNPCALCRKQAIAKIEIWLSALTLRRRGPGATPRRVEIHLLCAGHLADPGPLMGWRLRLPKPTKEKK